MFSRFAIVMAIAISVGCPFLARGQHQAVETEAATPLGHFVGVVKTLWSDDGRDMTLLEDFSYVDPDGLLWKAPAGSVTDGASIPQSAWSIIGGPFEGPYRLAAVIHDTACDKKERSWESVHEMFYRAMLTAHVNEVQAKIMYAAVYQFGPRWDLVTVAKGVPKSDTSAAINSSQMCQDSKNVTALACHCDHSCCRE
jgi:Protein of unknown function (DUF1353)